MKNDKIITINGQRYNIATNKPLTKTALSPDSLSTKRINNSAAVHSLAQKSHTLYRRATQKPIAQGAQLVRKVGHSMDIARSKSISHFAPRNAAGIAKPTVIKHQPDIGPVKHPLTNKIYNKEQPLRVTQHAGSTINKPAKLIKEEAISEALNKPTEKPEKKGFLKRHKKFINIFSVSFVLLITVAFFAYFNMPSLSVSVASAQAGINATYPEYHPDGYSLRGPVSYSDGEVNINFHANAGDSQFTIVQSKSSWDSTAVKNKVNKDSNGQFITIEERGLTIYTYNGNAAWVNGNILYSITGDARLDNNQIRRIATSL
jgi:hypothetical protein